MLTVNFPIETVNLEPYFSFWFNEMTTGRVNNKTDIAIELAKLSKAIADIAPWLSASLDSMSPCIEYVEACEQVFAVHQFSYTSQQLQT